MTALLIVVAAIVLLFIGYVFYGSWLAKQWGIDPTKKTPAIEKEDGVDYVAAKPAVLMVHIPQELRIRSGGTERHSASS